MKSAPGRAAGFLAAVCFAGLATPVQAQLAVTVGPEPPPVDSAYEARITQAWREVQAYWKQSGDSTTQRAMEAQRSYAVEFFEYYLDHLSTPTGERALSSAFTMWGNTGRVDEVAQALTRIDRESDVWPAILKGAGKAFAMQDREGAFVTILHELERTLTHPRSRSAVLLRLSEHYVEQGTPDSAIRRLERIVALDAHPFYVNRARGDLYELETLGIGRLAPDFTVTDIAGDTISLSGLRGKVVVLDFWATWCGPCRPEIPNLKTMAARHEDDDFILLGISLDDGLSELRSFVEEESITWPQILQTKQWEDEITTLYNVSAIPRSYVIDREGRIAHKDLRGAELAAAVAALLAQ